MTQQKINKLRTKIEESRQRLLKTNPFFALLLMYLKFVAVKDIKKISTNGRCIFFSPEFMEKLYWYEVDYILCHQVMHILMGDIWNNEEREDHDYHFSCDAVINRIFKLDGFLEDRYPHFRMIFKSLSAIPEGLKEITQKSVYENLMFSLRLFNEKERKGFFDDTVFYWNKFYDNGEKGTVILDINEDDSLVSEGGSGGSGLPDVEEENRESSSIMLEKIWQGRIAISATALQDCDNKQLGKHHELVQRILEKTKEAKLDWKKILNDFVQETVSDYSFSPPDRRFSETDFFLPDFNEKTFTSKEILFMVDTSGSVDIEGLTMVYSELKGALEQFSGTLSGKLGFFDVEVIEPIPFSNVDELFDIVPYGGGGTNFYCVFDYLKNISESDSPASLIIFTDGEAHFPDESYALGVPVLWIICNNDIVPPWGKVVKLDENI